MKNDIRKKVLKRKGLSLSKNKCFFGSFALLFSLILVVGATLAWTSYAEWTKNHIQSEAADKNLAVKIDEVFDPNWTPEITTKKEVNVTNTGEVDAKVRVSLKEVMLQFKMTYEIFPRAEYAKDNYNYGDVYEAEIGRATIEKEHSLTWVVGQTYKTKDTENKEHYYEGQKRIPPVGATEVGFNGANRETAISNWINLSFGPNVQSNQVGENDFWYYSDGYFYYAAILKAGETTKTPLLKGITLSNEFPNYMKSSLYDLIVKVEAISLKDSWE